jgi:hypothetical protein
MQSKHFAKRLTHPHKTMFELRKCKNTRRERGTDGFKKEGLV